MPSIAGRVLRALFTNDNHNKDTETFQCPPSRAGSCGFDGGPTIITGWVEFQCPPSRAGSCGRRCRSPQDYDLEVSVPSIAGRVLRAETARVLYLICLRL